MYVVKVVECSEVSLLQIEQYIALCISAEFYIICHLALGFLGSKNKMSAIIVVAEVSVLHAKGLAKWLASLSAP